MRFIALAAMPAMVTAASAPAWGAEPVPKVAPAPSWVVSTDLSAPEPKKAGGPIQFLLSSSQERITKSGVENYVEYAAIPLNAVGLQALGNVTVPWNVNRADLVIHKISIRRDGKILDVLKPEDILVLRRENNLEKAVLDGVRTVVVPAKGLQIGDILNVAFTQNVKTTNVARQPEEIQSITAPIAIGRIERRFIIPDDVKVSWKIASAIPQPAVNKSNGVTEYRFSANNVQPVEAPKYAPARFKEPLIQVSGYTSWAEVADQLTPLFGEARKLQANSALVAEIERIANVSKEPGARLLAALRLAQERVRYVALLLGEGAYVPASADETWERKFGDCKGKTALLLALLDRLGIEAEPILVSNAYDDRIGDQLPSMFMFDHVIVRARIGANAYFLDATDYGQRTLAELSIPGFSYGLALRPKASLETLPQGVLDTPVREVTLTWDARTGTDGKFPYEAVLTLRGSVAATMRAKVAAATDSEKLDDQFKDMVPGIDNENLTVVDKNPEVSDGSFVVKFRGTAEMDWSPFEGKRESRFALSNGTIKWKPDFDRTEGPGQDWPVFLGSRPYWERLTETIILPNGGKGYSVEGTSIGKSVGGSTISRSTKLAGDRVIQVSDFRHVKREISAAEARAALPILEEISGDYAYVVGPPNRKKSR